MVFSHARSAPFQWFAPLASALDSRSAPRLALLFLGAVLARGAADRHKLAGTRGNPRLGTSPGRAAKTGKTLNAKNMSGARMRDFLRDPGSAGHCAWPTRFAFQVAQVEASRSRTG